MKKLIKRIAALFAAGCIFMMNGLMLTVSAEYSSDKEYEDKGYWKFYEMISTVNDHEDRGTMMNGWGTVFPSPALTTWTYSDGSWKGKYYVEEDWYHTESSELYYAKGDQATSYGTYSIDGGLPEIIHEGDTISVTCDLNGDAQKRDVKGDLFVALHFNVYCSMIWLYTDWDGNDGSMTTGDKFLSGSLQSTIDEPNKSETFTSDPIPKNNNYYPYEPWASSETDWQEELDTYLLEISFQLDGGYVKYRYKWEPNVVEVTAAENASSEADDSLWIIQNESKNALDSAGEDSGTEINPAIITGKKEHDDRPSTAAEKALAAAGGAGVATAAALAASNNSKKKKISYKMLISKDFGDTLEPWQEYTVYARIVQVHNEAGLTRNADEYTRQITAFSDNMPLNSYYHTPSQRFAATFKVTDDNADKATLSFKFKGKGGVFTEHVTFKVKSTEKNINFVYFNSDGSIGEIFDKYDDVRPHGLFLGENAFSTLYIYTTGFSSMPELTCECDSFMLRPTAVPLPNFNTSPKISEFAKRYPWYNDMVNAKFFKVDLNNKTQKSPSMFGKYPLNTNVTFTAKSERGAAVSRTLPVFIVPKGFYIDIDAFDERQKSNEYIELYTNELVDVNRSQLRSTRIPVNIGFAYIGAYRRVSGYHDNNRLIPVERVTFDSGLCKDEYTPTSAAASNIKLKKEFFFETSYADYNDVYSDRRYYIGWHRDEGHSHNAVMEFCPKMPLLVNNNTDELLFDLEVYYEAINTETQALIDKHDIPLKCKVPVRIYGEPADSALHARHEELLKLDKIIKIMQLEGTGPVEMLTENARAIATNDLYKTRKWIFDFGREYQQLIFREEIENSRAYSETIAYLTTLKWASDVAFSYCLKYYCKVHQPPLDDNLAEAVVMPLKGFIEDYAAAYSVSYFWQEPEPDFWDHERLAKLGDGFLDALVLGKAKDVDLKKLAKLLAIAALYTTIFTAGAEWSKKDEKESLWWRIIKNSFKNMTKKALKIFVGRYVLKKFMNDLSENNSTIENEFAWHIGGLEETAIDSLRDTSDMGDEYREYARDLRLTKEQETFDAMLTRLTAEYGYYEFKNPDGSTFKQPKIAAWLMYPDKLLEKWGYEKLKPLFENIPDAPPTDGYLPPKEARTIMEQHGIDASKITWN